MTAYEVTQDLLAASEKAAAAPTAPARIHRTGWFRAVLTAGMAAGALVLAVPAASAAQAAPAPTHSTISESSLSSTLPSTITLTTRRTGSVIL